MNSISPKTLCSLSSLSSPSCPFRIFITHLSTSSISSSRRQDEESRNVRVSVWWDFENCNVPAGVNVFKVAHTITAAIRANGIKGPITITAFGDVLQLSRANQEALSSTGINISHVPHGGKNSADRSLLVDLMYWVSHNPPPAHLFLISGDRDFASILHRLRMNNYNILLASRASTPNVLCSAASIMWNWEALVRGEDIAGKHFNQPPDGPYGSWYGHFKARLVDPYSSAEQPACSRSDEVSEPASDSKLRPVSKPLVRQIRHILNSHPSGITITELRTELSRSAVNLDKELYGYKKFSRFLLSMSNILKLEPEADGQFLVRGISPKAPEPFETSMGTSNQNVCKNGNQELSKSLKLNGDERFKEGAAEGNTVLPSSPEAQKLPGSSKNKKVGNTDVQDHPDNVQQTRPIEKKFADPVVVQEAGGHRPLESKQDSASELGFFKTIWIRWFGGKNEGVIKSQNIPEKHNSSGDVSEKISRKIPEKSLSLGDSEKIKLKENHMTSPGQDSDPIESVCENKTVRSAKVCGEKPTTSPGVLTRFVNWCKFRRSRPDSDALRDQKNSNFQKHEVFLKDSFWLDMESFMDSPRGSVIVSCSETRKQMAQGLQKEGPLALRDLSELDLVDLVDILISEKKWVEEYPSEESPFKLTRLVGKRSSLDQSPVNGLRSIFSDSPSQSKSSQVQENGGEKKSLNIPHSRVGYKKPSDKSRSDTLADCQKLVNEILKEYPEGYNLGSFRKLFMERYGYHLNEQKLGYQKLAALIQIMPGVKIESTYILPYSKVTDGSVLRTSLPDFQETTADHLSVYSDSDASETSKKSDDSDSPWEELGPVSDLSFDGKDMQSGQKSRAMKYTRTQMFPDYEPSVSDDELSDSEGEKSSRTQPEGREKPQINEEDSSLLEILDSWYSSKEGDNKNKSENVDGHVDCSTDCINPSAPSEVATKSEASTGNFGRKQRPQKNYSFVSDPIDNDKDKLIDGILGSLKKSGSQGCRDEIL